MTPQFPSPVSPSGGLHPIGLILDTCMYSVLLSVLFPNVVSNDLPAIIALLGVKFALNRLVKTSTLPGKIHDPPGARSAIPKVTVGRGG